MIQQNITIFLGVDYTIFGNSRILKPQEYRAVARALIGGGGGVYSYIQVLPD